MENIAIIIGNNLLDALNNIIAFIPRIVSAVIIFAVGLFAANFLRAVSRRIFGLIDLGKFFQKAGITDKSVVAGWTNIASQVIYWFVFLTFLIPVLNVLQLPNLTSLVNQLVSYLPNVFAAVIIGFIGFIAANAASQLVREGTRTLDRRSSLLFSNTAYFSLIFFTVLLVLNQLQVASQLIQILLTGFVAMLALAGGLAFGIGGRDTAREILHELFPKETVRRLTHPKMKAVSFAHEVRRGKKRKTKKSN